jgi:hypothetical protein
MSSEEEEGGVVFFVPALKGRMVEGGAAMICERIEDVGKGRWEVGSCVGRGKVGVVERVVFVSDEEGGGAHPKTSGIRGE